MNIEWWYCTIPNAVMLDKRLTPNQKLLYWIISSLCAKKWYCRATNKFIWDMLWVNKTSVSNGISKLVECWYITTEWEYEQRAIALNMMIQWLNLSSLINEDDIEDEMEDEVEDTVEFKNKVKEKVKEKGENDNLFEEFREKYPRKVNKKKAETSFKKLSDEDKRLAIDMIDKFKKTKQWQDKQYIPHPTTYLNWLRFKDEVEERDMAWYVDKSKTEEIKKDEKIEEKFMQLWNEYPQSRRTNETEAKQIFYSMTEEEQDKSISMLKIYKMSDKWNNNDWQYVIWICRYLKEKVYNIDPDEEKYHLSDPNSRWIRNSRWYIEEKYYLCH